MTDIAQRLTAVRCQIAEFAQIADRDPSTIQLLAVSKTQPIEALQAAIKAGQRAFGENYLQDALPKIEALSNMDLEWHFIGPVQSNKTRQIAEHFDWVHSVDRLKIAQRLNDQRPDNSGRLNICIQVNIHREPQKAGVLPEDIESLATSIQDLPRLRLRGLMAIPQAGLDIPAQHQAFAELRSQFVQLGKLGLQLDTLSMGMSHDMPAAIAEGATLVRIGTAIFGPRSKPAPHPDPTPDPAGPASI